ncbi:thioredoxin family protein [Bacteroidota bacterium]
MKLFITTLILLFSLNIYSQDTEKEHLKWYTFEEVTELVKTQPRPVLVDVYTDWCGWCKKMDKATYENPGIIKYMNENYYAIKFNAETKDTVIFHGKEFLNTRASQRRGSHDLAIALLQGKMSYPTTVFLNGELQLLTAAPGYLDAPKMEPILYFFAEEAYKNQTFEDFQKEFKSGL